MNLELRNVKTAQVDGGTRLIASVVAVDYADRTGDPFTASTSCWADLLTQWNDPTNADPKHLVKKFLIKEAVQSAQAELDKAQAYADAELYQAQVLPDDDPDKAAKVQAAQEWKAALDGFAALMDAEIPVRVNSFYGALKAFHEGKGEVEQAAQVQAEWDTWQATQVDHTGLEGPVYP